MNVRVEDFLIIIIAKCTGGLGEHKCLHHTLSFYEGMNEFTMSVKNKPAEEQYQLPTCLLHT